MVPAPAGRVDRAGRVLDRLSQTLRHVTGKAKLTEDNIKDTLREVRMALLEADVALPVVKEFVNRVKERAVGTEVSKSLTPGQAFVKIVRAELEELMGAANEDLALNVAPPAVVLMAGLQGAGKTTTVGKLARFLKERKKKSVLVVSAGLIAACTAWISAIISASIARRPAVSTSTTSMNLSLASRIAAWAISTGFWLVSDGKKVTPTSPASVSSCLIAAGR
ncbi:signal recognition particle receptor subunit alpha [Methylobacterium organophilum]|nr:signal recognition particle receptor subunit alpha [Methylobacterium organophilum]